MERRSEIHAAIQEDYPQPVERRKRSARADLLLAVRAAHRQRRGAGFGLRGDFCRRGVHHSSASRSYRYQIAEPFVALGAADWRSVSKEFLTRRILANEQSQPIRRGGDRRGSFRRVDRLAFGAARETCAAGGRVWTGERTSKL